jgi:hypothetical protein
MSNCNHASRFFQWEDHRQPIQCALCEIERLRQQLEKFEELRRERDELNDEISYYEALADDEFQDWPHRDGRYREWLYSRLREREQAAAEIDRLRAELDNARSAVRGMSTFLTNEELVWACDTWPWLGEVEDE